MQLINVKKSFVFATADSQTEFKIIFYLPTVFLQFKTKSWNCYFLATHFTLFFTPDCLTRHLPSPTLNIFSFFLQSRAGSKSELALSRGGRQRRLGRLFLRFWQRSRSSFARGCGGRTIVQIIEDVQARGLVLAWRSWRIGRAGILRLSGEAQD